MLSKIYKLVFDISICFIIGGFLLKFFGNIPMSAGNYLALILAGIVAVFFYKIIIVKYLTMTVLPILYLVMVPQALPAGIVFLLIWVYFAYVMIANRFENSRGVFLDKIKRILVLSLVLIIPLITDFSRFSAAIAVISPYLVGAVVSAVFLLRHMRVGNEMEQMRIYERQQFIELAIFLVICVFLTLLKAPMHIWEGVSLLYHHVLAPVVIFLISIIGMLVYGILYLGAFLVDAMQGTSNSQEIKILIGEIISENSNNAEVKTFQALPILYTIGAVAAIVILFLFFRWLMGNVYSSNIPAGIVETRESIADLTGKKEKIRRRSPKNPREAVRYYYEKYMIWLQTKQVPLKANNTTEEINDKYKQFIISNLEEKTKAANDFGRIYQKARYQMTSDITEEEAAMTKSLYQSIKNSKMKRK